MNPYHYEIERPDGLPDGEQSLKSCPVMVFLHGWGERGGTTRDQVRVHGPWRRRPFNRRVQARLEPYFVIAPHLPADAKTWDAQRVLDTLCSAFEEMKKSHGDQVVDVGKVIITGISLGGRGALDVAALGFPDPQEVACDTSPAHCRPFRAAAIICPMQGSNAQLNTETRYQFFHRDNDWNGHTRDTYPNLAEPRCYHRYQGCNHNCWTATYANSALYDWFNDPQGDQKWGPACDASGCVDPASELVQVRVQTSGKAPFSATFCPTHADQFRLWVKYAEYISKVP